MGRILVVDDDPGVRGMLPRLLADLGHRADAVATTAEMEAALAAAEYDLLMLDVVLDKENGWEALRLARERTPAPVMMVSGASMDAEALADARTLGAQAVLQKPFERADLAAALAELLAEGAA